MYLRLFCVDVEDAEELVAVDVYFTDGHPEGTVRVKAAVFGREPACTRLN